MTRLRSWAVVPLVTVLVAVLAACGGLPTAGPVNAGKSIVEEQTGGDLVFIPDGPAPGATPQQIVDGFIAAGSGPGPRGTWETAREFLAPEARAVWNPGAGVTVYSPGQRRLAATTESEYQLTITPIATVDSAGVFATAGGEGETRLVFELAVQADGQWRITQAPDGIVLDRGRFGTVFSAYSLMFFDPSWTYLVPDQRWFPRINAATSIAEALVDGTPSPWLTGAVASAFTEATRLSRPASVPVRANVAEVSLDDGARTQDSLVLNRMQTQLAESLQTAGVTDVTMLVSGQPLAAEAVPVRSTKVNSRPLVRTDDGFGFLSGGALEEIPGLSDALAEVDTAAIDVDADRTTAAVQTPAGEIASVRGDGRVLSLDGRQGLLAPSIDPLDFVWTVPSAAPDAVIAYGPDGSPHPLAEGWTGASEIAAQRVSRDGTRIAAVVREGLTTSLWVAGVLRDAQGTPIALGERTLLATLPGDGIGVSWLDPVTLAVAYSDQGEGWMHVQPIGGFGSVQRTPETVTTITGSGEVGGVRLRDANGELFLQRGGNWQQVTGGVHVLATQQGSPR